MYRATVDWAQRLFNAATRGAEVSEAIFRAVKISLIVSGNSLFSQKLPGPMSREFGCKPSKSPLRVPKNLNTGVVVMKSAQDGA